MVDRVGQQLGNYRLVRLLGQGGFAEVYLGEHVHLDTLAAIKILQTQLAHEDMEQFRLEARTIARLEHPHIVRVFDFGIESNTPFLIMSYAPNGTLRAQHPKGTRVPLSTVVSYVQQIAPALQYAHDQRLIHRDIKPENLLVGRAHEILLSDFGIALVAQSSRYQSTRDMAGTIAYMAPEQIEAHPRLASDQYSLGIVVYEWLSGDRPFHGSFTEIAIKHSVVPPPSLREKLPTLAPEVEQVVLTALAKDPMQRFTSVQAFAIALEQASQVGTNVETLPASVTLSVTGEKTLLGSTQLPAQIATQPSESVIPTEPITPQSQAATLPTEVAPPSLLSVAPPVEMPPAEPPHQGISRRMIVVGLAGLAVVGVAGGSLLWLTRSQPPSAPSTSTSTLTATPLSVVTPLYIFQGHSDVVRGVSWSPNGKRIASASSDTTVQVWDAMDGGNLYKYTGHSYIVHAVSWSPDGSRIASASEDGTVQVWDALGGGHVYKYSKYPTFTPVDAVTWSPPHGKRIASAGDDGTGMVQVWDALDGGHLFEYRGHTDFVYSVSWSSDGTRIASGGADGTIQVWNALDGGLVYKYLGHTGNVTTVAWSPHGTRIASGGVDGTVQVWDAMNGGHVYKYHRHSSGISAVAWSPNGKRIVSGSWDKTVQVWDALDGGHVYKYRGHTDSVNAVAWSPDSKHIASASSDTTVRVWQAS